MTLSSTTVKTTFSGDGSTTDFATGFTFWNSSELKVILVSSSGDETTWTQGTEYTVTGGEGAAGTVSASTDPTDFTPDTGETLVVKSDVLNIQETSLPAGGAFPSTSVEEEFDRTVRRIQQDREIFDRALTYPEAESTGTSNILPDSSSRASKYLGFDANGNPIALAGTAEDADVSTNTVLATGSTTARSLALRFADTINVKDYGAVGDGVTDDTTAIQAAIDAVPTGGGIVYLPPGTYLVSSALNINASSVHIVGAGVGATIVTTNSATADIFAFGDGATARSQLSIRDMRIETSAAKSAGAGVHFNNATSVWVANLRMSSMFIGISYENANIGIIENVEMRDTVASTGVGIDVFARSNSSLEIKKVLMDAATDPLAGIRIREGASINIIDCEIINQGIGLQIIPDATIVIGSVYVRSSFFDNCDTHGIQINAASGTTVQRVSISGSWMSSSGGRGLIAAGAGTIDGITVLDCRVLLNVQQGILVSTGENFIAASNSISGNSAPPSASGTFAGIHIGAEISEFVIVGNRIGPYGQITETQNRGITIDSGGSDNFVISSNDLRGNTAGGILDQSTGTNKQIFGNIPFENVDQLTLGNGAALTRHLSATATLDFDLTAVDTQDLTITVTGAALGDTVALGVPNGSVTASTLFWAWVSAANTVTVRAMRIAGTPNPASGTFRVDVWKH